jgi:phosphoesterase RecJ-like protein
LPIQILFILKNTDKQVITSVKEILTSRIKNIIIVPHENPDGDAIGSAIGLAEILINFGHKVTVISPNDYPDFLKWFSSDVEILIYRDKKKISKQVVENADVLICVDFNEPKRAENLEKKIVGFNKTKILIDHHPNPSEFCDYTISEIHYSSTAELIFDVVKAIGMKKNLTGNAAEALYTGILTDTGSFSHNTSNPNTFRVVSELMKYKIDIGKIQSNIYHNFSTDRMKLLGYCLNNKMTVFPDLRAAFISITKKELEEFNFKPGDTEGFVNYPLSIHNIVFSAFFIEKEGLVKASFRSKGSFPSNLFSRNHFNGGGHLNAAGGESYQNLEETIEKFTQLLPDYKHQLLETII